MRCAAIAFANNILGEHTLRQSIGEQMTLSTYIEEIQDETRPIRRSELLQLSGLGREDIREFRAAWLGVHRNRRREILALLVELSEDNLELDFGSIFRSCLSDDCELVREQATRGLLETDDRMVIRPLVAMLKDDPSTKVRAAAAITLSKFSDMAQQGKLMSRDEDRIREALLAIVANADEDIDVRRRSIEAVASFDTPEITQIVRDAYGSNHPTMQQSAIYAMGRTSNSEWLQIVLSELNSNNPAIRYEAATACGLIGDETTIAHIIELIGDEDIEVQTAAIGALGNIGGSLAKRALIQAIKIGDEALTDTALAALANIEFDEDPLGF